MNEQVCKCLLCPCKGKHPQGGSRQNKRNVYKRAQSKGIYSEV